MCGGVGRTKFMPRHDKSWDCRNLETWLRIQWEEQGRVRGQEEPQGFKVHCRGGVGEMLRREKPGGKEEGLAGVWDRRTGTPGERVWGESRAGGTANGDTPM